MSNEPSIQLEAVAEGIFRAPILTAGACHALVASMERSSSWQSASVIAGAGVQRALSSVRRADVLPEQALSAHGLRAAVLKALPPIAELVDEPLTLGPLELVRYPVNGQYRVHTDFGPATIRRVYTALVYLNDDFSGGETAFPDLAYSARPRRGDLLLFPSYLRHAGKPVAGNPKYIAVGWLLADEVAPWIAHVAPGLLELHEP